MGSAGRQLLWHLKKISEYSVHANSYSRQVSPMGNTTAAFISSKLPHGHTRQCFGSTFLHVSGMTAISSSSLANGHTRHGLRGIFLHVSAFSNIRRFIAERIVKIKHSSGFRRYSGGSSFSSEEGIVYGIIAGNIAVHLLWREADQRFMYKNFQISVDNFLNGRVHTLITHAFSHKDPYHLFSNMFGFYFFGSGVARTFGSKYLFMLYLAGALGGSIFFLIDKAVIVPWRMGISINDFNPRYTPPALGASGAVNAILLLNIFLNPKRIIYMQLFIPVPAMLFGAFVILQDLWRVKQLDSNTMLVFWDRCKCAKRCHVCLGNTQISGAAHLGGALVGALAWAKIRRPWI